MLIFTKGDIFESEAEALVNPVNCVGVMGKGLALQFKNKYPDMFRIYRQSCFNKGLKPGTVMAVQEQDKLIINFPTKNHWRDRSEMRYITSGLDALKDTIRTKNVQSIAIPPIGCGLGGLKWSDVKQEIIRQLNDLDCKIFIYEP